MIEDGVCGRDVDSLPYFRFETASGLLTVLVEGGPPEINRTISARSNSPATPPTKVSDFLCFSTKLVPSGSKPVAVSCRIVCSCFGVGAGFGSGSTVLAAGVASYADPHAGQADFFVGSKTVPHTHRTRVFAILELYRNRHVLRRPTHGVDVFRLFRPSLSHGPRSPCRVVR